MVSDYELNATFVEICKGKGIINPSIKVDYDSESGVRVWLRGNARNVDDEIVRKIIPDCFTSPQKFGKSTLFENGSARIWVHRYFPNPRACSIVYETTGEVSTDDILFMSRAYPLLCKKKNSQSMIKISQEQKQRIEETGAQVYAPDISYDWDCLAGYNAVKKRVKETILLPMLHPDVFEDIAKITRKRSYGQRAKGVLFEGPSGTGKTTMAKIIAREAKCPFIYVPFHQMMTKWFGESENNVAKVFDAVAELDYAMVLLDEVDTVVPRRDQSNYAGDRRILSVLLRKLDGFEANPNLVVIGTTNRSEDLDPALLSRFGSRITFNLPNPVERCWIFQSYAQQLSSEEIGELGRKAEGLSGRDIFNVCERVEDTWARKVIEGAAHTMMPPVGQYQEVLEELVKEPEKIGF